MDSILEHGNHSFLNQPLHVSRPAVKRDVRSQDNEGATNAILVEGLRPEVGRDVLELFFENTKRSGGGDITDIQMYQESGRAIIWFADASGNVYSFIDHKFDDSGKSPTWIQSFSYIFSEVRV